MTLDSCSKAPSKNEIPNLIKDASMSGLLFQSLLVSPYSATKGGGSPDAFFH